MEEGINAADGNVSNLSNDPSQAGLPRYTGEDRGLHRLAYEAWDHLWPWSRRGFRGRRFVLALSLALATAVSVVWLLAAAGRLGPTVVVAWWVGWSVFEIPIRLQSKPYVKEGPWWGRQYRRASLPDLICYVAFKNLLIGAGLFLALRTIGLLDFLHGLPGLKWLYV